MKKVVVVMPAYNASKTLEMTYNEINKELVDDILLVDDYSRDDTVEKAKGLGIKVIAHHKNMGYGANSKTCYGEALKMGADIVVKLHPDFQYSPGHLDKMVELLKNDEADAVLGSRILGGGALAGGMPVYKYLGNMLLNLIQNSAYGLRLSDYATGYKAYRKEVLERIPFHLNSDGFLFDEELNTQIVHFGFRLAQIPIPTKYFDEASTVNFTESLFYGIETVWTVFKWLLHRAGIVRFRIFCEKGA
jgi:glycosyltransferase involved in cell wall biosynthesis